MSKYVVWKVPAIERNTFATLDEAIVEATRIVETENRESVVIVKAMRQVTIKPKISVRVVNLDTK